MEASSESVNDTDYLPAMSLWDDLPNALTNPLAQGLKYIAYYMIACIAITLALATFGQFSFIIVAFFGIDLIPKRNTRLGNFLVDVQMTILAFWELMMLSGGVLIYLTHSTRCVWLGVIKMMAYCTWMTGPGLGWLGLGAAGIIAFLWLQTFLRGFRKRLDAGWPVWDEWDGEWEA